jgi:hypothetical protein
MLRQLKDEPNFRIWNYLGRLGRDHAESYVERFLDGMPADYYTPTPQEKEFAVDAVIKRAQEIFDRMEANGEFPWSNKHTT